MYGHGFLFLAFLKTARRSVLRTGDCTVPTARASFDVYGHQCACSITSFFRYFGTSFSGRPPHCVGLLARCTHRQHRRRSGARTAAAPTLCPLPLHSYTHKLRKAPHFWKGGPWHQVCRSTHALATLQLPDSSRHHSTPSLTGPPSRATVTRWILQPPLLLSLSFRLSRPPSVRHTPFLGVSFASHTGE